MQTKELIMAMSNVKTRLPAGTALSTAIILVMFLLATAGFAADADEELKIEDAPFNIEDPLNPTIAAY
jgi:hypothetical protein